MKNQITKQEMIANAFYFLQSTAFATHNFTQKKCCEMINTKNKKHIITQSGLSRIIGSVKDGETPYSKNIDQIWALMEQVLADYGVIYNPDSRVFKQSQTLERLPIPPPNVNGSGKNKFKDFGILDVASKFQIARFEELIKHANERIWILHTYFSSTAHLVHSFKIAVKKKIKIQLLLTHPNGGATDLRSNSLEISVKESIFECLKILAKYPELRENVEVRFYDRLPGVNIFGVDQTAFVGNFWEHTPSVSGTFILMGHKGRVAFDNVVEHFEKMWENALYCPLTEDFQTLKQHINAGILNRGGKKKAHFDKIDQDKLCCFRVFYFQEGNAKSMNMVINKESSQVHLTNTESRDDYWGRIQSVSNNSIIDIRTMDENNPRTARIVIHTKMRLLCKKEVTTAVFINIHPKGYPECGPMVIQKIPHSELNQTGNVQSAISEFLSALPREAKTSGAISIQELEKSLRIYLPDFPLQQTMVKDVAGDYVFYSINPTNHKIIKGYFRIGTDGHVTFLHHAYRTDAGHISVIDPSHILVTNREVHFKVAQYFNIFKVIKQNGKIILKGCYAGLGHTNFPTGGRIYATRINEIPFEMTKVDTFKWQGKKYKKLIKEIPDLEAFFSGLQDCFIENPSTLRRSPNILQVSKGDSIDSYTGTYALFLQSQYERKIRRCLIEILPGGKVRMKGMRHYIGTVLRYGHILQIILFPKQEGDQQIYAFMQCWVPDQIKPGNLVGIMSSVSRWGIPISRKIVLFSVANHYEKENQSLVSFDDEGLRNLELQYPGFISYLFSGEGGLVKIPKESDFEKFPTYQEEAVRAFQSGCFASKKGREKEALAELAEAFLLGFSDCDSLNEELEPAGSLFALRDKVTEMKKRAGME